jgi:hypothetical protein
MLLSSLRILGIQEIRLPIFDPRLLLFGQRYWKATPRHRPMTGLGGSLVRELFAHELQILSLKTLCVLGFV